MKIRPGFVSNSSSASFLITNKTGKRLKFSNFIDDVYYELERLSRKRDWLIFDREAIKKEVRANQSKFSPGASNVYEFEYSDGGTLSVLLYELASGSSENFTWKKYYDYEDGFMKNVVTEEDDRVHQRKKQRKKQRMRR